MRKPPNGGPCGLNAIRLARCALREQIATLGGEALARLPGEAAFRVLVQAADRIAEQRRSPARGVAVGSGAQRLLQGALEAVEELVHPRLQALVLADQRVAGHDAHHAWILLRERKQHLDQLGRLPQAVGLALGDAVRQREYRALDELD